MESVNALILIQILYVHKLLLKKKITLLNIFIFHAYRRNIQNQNITFIGFEHFFFFHFKSSLPGMKTMNIQRL